MDNNTAILKENYRKYLSSLAIQELRCYGRFLQLQKPTKMRKEALIEEIILVLCDEMISTRNRRGAPVKNFYYNPRIHETIQSISNGQLKVTPTPPLYPRQEIKLPKIVNIHLKIEPDSLNQEQVKHLTALLQSLQ